MAIFRKDLQKLSAIRLKEAGVLLRAELYDGAYHLAGLSVECGLKAIIAKQTGRHEFPDKHKAIKCFEHDLEKLARIAGIFADIERQSRLSTQFSVNWAQVAQWDVELRYEVRHDRQAVLDFYSAITSRTNGVMQLVKTQW